MARWSDKAALGLAQALKLKEPKIDHKFYRKMPLFQVLGLASLSYGTYPCAMAQGACQANMI